MKDFRWNDWNLDKMDKHGVSFREAERVVRNATPPYPTKIGDGKWLVIGRGQGGRVIEVIYINSPADTIFVVHAMPLTTRRRRS